MMHWMALLVFMLSCINQVLGQELLEGEFEIEFGKKLIGYSAGDKNILPSKFPSITEVTKMLSDENIHAMLFFQIFNDENNNYTPQWSYNGTQISFLQADINRRTCKIKLIEDLASGKVSTLFPETPDSYDYMFDWSPFSNGCYAFSSQKSGDMDIYLCTGNDGSIKITSGGDIKKHPDISPNASPLWIIYEDKGKIQSLRFSGRTNIPTPEKLGNGTCPEFSPDGKQIVYVKEIGRENDRPIYDIVILHLQTEREETVFVSQGKDLRNPAWSPDSKKIAFYVNNPSVSFDWDIYIKDISNSKKPPLPVKNVVIENHFDFFGPAWEPQSQKVFFFSDIDQRDGYYRVHWADLNGASGVIEYSDDITTATDLAINPNPDQCDLAFAGIEEVSQGIYILILNHY